ncbi:type II toxin-antitoxin system RelE/ParE family toxin [Synoicihabitans lomoniglobus]|uniref:type II toxin-antitoxin system RelE/ParE family toxin n=1 Tax=Synoicihabitans lomoniglobus TaxID=2909285 RepID=UPI002ED60E2C|nr:type II toxin-antitoxin system RelE/ParE family toxin [Opitutaceae bacterium LMO-M01]
MRIRVTSAAHRDLIEAHDWYEAESPGLGRALVTAVDTVFHFILEHPTLPRAVLRDLRRVHTKRFPYAIYYELRDHDTVRIVAVFHTARNQSSLATRQ